MRHEIGALDERTDWRSRERNNHSGCEGLLRKGSGPAIEDPKMVFPRVVQDDFIAKAELLKEWRKLKKLPPNVTESQAESIIRRGDEFSAARKPAASEVRQTIMHAEPEPLRLAS